MLNKSEKRELANIVIMHKMGMIDTVARSLSTLIRSARTKKAALELKEYAPIFNVTNHPDFIC
jgi:hypothetical protein